MRVTTQGRRILKKYRTHAGLLTSYYHEDFDPPGLVTQIRDDDVIMFGVAKEEYKVSKTRRKINRLRYKINHVQNDKETI